MSQYVFAGGQYHGLLKKYDQADLSFVNSVDVSSGSLKSISAIVTDDEFVYVGGAFKQDRKVVTSDTPYFEKGAFTDYWVAMRMMVRILVLIMCVMLKT